MSDSNQQAEEKYDPPKIEQEIIRFWEENKIFEKSLELRKNGRRFVFLEGPPTANGMPHPGHVLTRTAKDVILRYKTMNGYYVERKAGWDTHGLPVEIEVEKLLGLKNKQEIEEYGIKKFNEECKKSVFKYEEAWKEMTKRVGFWIDMDNPYITLKNDYIESVWWSLKKAWENGLLARGYRVTPYCPRCGTTLSSHEVAQGYKEVSDPSIFVKFKVRDKDEYFLAWTTTPWTLISNAALAVNPDEWYIKIEYMGEKLILSETRADALLKNEEYKILDGWKGEELIGMKYEPLYTYAKPEKECWYVIGADFVSMDEGTGIVHIAPAFGEDDYEAGQKYDLPVIQLVRKDGTFPPEVDKWAGMFVKDADKEIIEDLKSRGLLMSVQEYTHQYPFCWRCNSPLLYYAIESWFIKMSKLRKQLVENNEKIKWHPEYLKHGRFGEFIKDVRDWSLSRKRYWGTPLPVWKCKECGNEICVGSVDELRSLSENFPEEYDLHRPFVDELEVKCPKCGGKMKREEEVIDAWYDSGSAFFAQWHYPFENQDKFKENFPADFICEAIDQTRGWFYSLLAVSTLNFNDTPYKEVLSLGHILDKEGLKMSKKARNYIEPSEIFNREGADAMRWYLLSTSAPWSPKRFYEQVVKDALGKFLLTLWNTYSFYSTYSNLDNFDYHTKKVPFEERSLLDKWILSKMNNVIKSVVEKIENFEIHKAAREIEEFVVRDISNWYIRNSRKRFWLEEETPDKLSGYSTIREVLSTLSKLLAPFVPFISEKIYLSLGEGESVHLCDYPVPDESMINEELEVKMEKVRDITEVARALRAKKGIKVRYPLSKVIVVTGEDISDIAELLKDEINVKEVEFSDSVSPFVEKIVKPNYSSLGPRFKENAGKVASAIEKLSPEEIENKKIVVNGKEYVLEENDYVVEEKEKEGFAIGSTGDDYIVLCTEQTPELIAEGFSREIIRRIQEMRKDMNLEMEDRIISSVDIDSGRVKGWEEYIKGETRSEKLVFGEASGDTVKEWNIDGEKITIGIRRV
ncbi:MAG: isoleucine--tRNA ligase [Thermoplasmata archaeon]|nr:MAG: isoleucine--tRNA ligase [Thermoplasmata archaeon]